MGTPRRVDVVVVGGGVMGSATAWSLARRGVGVVLLEQFGPGHDLGASHGRARIYRCTNAEPHHQTLVAEGRRLWAELEDETGRRVLYPGAGVATAAPAGQARRREVAAAMQRAGIQHEWLPPAEAAQRWPGLRFPGPVLHEPHTAARVDADAAVAALQEAAAAHGAVVGHHRRVTAVLPDGDGIRVRLAAGGDGAGPRRRRHRKRLDARPPRPRGSRAAAAGHRGAARSLPAGVGRPGLAVVDRRSRPDRGLTGQGLRPGQPGGGRHGRLPRRGRRVHTRHPRLPSRPHAAGPAPGVRPSLAARARPRVRLGQPGVPALALAAHANHSAVPA